MKNVSTHDAFYKQISAHDHNHRLDGDNTPRGSTHHVHDRIFGIFEQK